MKVTGAGAGLVAVALLVVAAAVTVTAPTDDEIQAPLETRGGVGDTVSARTTQVQMHSVTLAETVEFDNETGIASSGDPVATDGVWVAIDVTTVCTLEDCGFDDSVLRVGDRTFAAAVLAPVPSFVAQIAAAGLPYRSTALFEIPRSALDDGSAELVVQIVDTQPLDGVPVVEFELPAEIDPVTVVQPSRIEQDVA